MRRPDAWDELMFEAHVFFVYINITLSFTLRAWAQPILILMTMKYVCRIVVMLALLFTYQVNVQAKVVFAAGTDYEEDGIVSKHGVSINGVKTYWGEDGHFNYVDAFGTTNFSVSSENGNIVMIGISYSPFEFRDQSEWESNSFQGSKNKEGGKNHPNKMISVNTNWIESSVGSIENGNFYIFGDFWDQDFSYSIWRGSSSFINFSFNNNRVFIREITVYFEGDELPVKKPFSIIYYEDYLSDSDIYDSMFYSSLNIFYGYKEFIQGYSGGWDYRHCDSELSYFTEGGSLPKRYSNWEGSKSSYDRINFDSSFSEYYPKNISYLFQGLKSEQIVNFSDLNLSEVNNASYMFKNSNVVVEDLHIDEGENLSYMFSGYANRSLNISSWNFSPNTIVTGMFSNSSIQFLTVGPSINNARNDIFNGLGTYSNPCNLEIIGNVNLGQDPGESVFYWKGGYFILPQKEPYVSVEEQDYLYYYTFRYDSYKIMHDKTFSIDEKGLDYKKWVEDYNSFQYSIREGEEGLYYYDDNGDYHRLNGLSVKIDPSFAEYRPTSTSEWFYYCEAEKIEGLQYLNTSEVTDMSLMFCGCNNLSSIIDVSHFDTSKVKNMLGMFEGCNSVTLDVSNFNTSNVTNMAEMFAWLPLSSLDISNFDTSKVTDMSSMFAECYNLKSLDLKNFDTSKVIDMSFMFARCSSLQSLDLSNFDTSNVTDMNGMFALGYEEIGYEDSQLEYLDVSNFNTSKVTAMIYMFYGCNNLSSLDVSNFNTTNVQDMSEMFAGCSNLSSLNVSNFDTSNLVEGIGTGSYEMFSDCSSLQELSVSSTMANIQENACQRVGSKNSPCTIYAPKNFDFGTNTTQSYFIWKSGFFVKGADIVTYAVGDIITYEGLQYQVTKVEDTSNEVTLIKNPDAQGEIIIPSVIEDESGTVGFYVTAIEDYAFYNCANITKLSIPATVRSIGIAITSCCTILNDITVAEDNPYYDSRDNCNAVINTATGELLAGCNKTTIPEGVTAIGTEAMRGMFDLEGIILPSTLTRIGNRAFYYCKKLTGHLAIPEGVTEIETYAFYKCTGITAISLPSTITTMGTCAFRECTEVTWVSCYADTPPSIDSRMFGKFAGCTLMVPTASVDTYKAATNWKKFDPIIRESVVSVEDVAILTGNKGTARISLDNGTNVYTGCQFNITLPEGTDLVKQTYGGYDYTVSSRFSGTPSVQITPQEDGSYMVLIYSMNNTAIIGSEGVLISLPVKVVTGLPAGDYLGTITNIAFNNPDNTSAYLADVTFNITMPSFTLGDVNHDRTINITDVMMTVNHVVGQTPAGFHVENADVNGDHVINISDIMAIVNLVVNATSSNAPAHAREAMTDAISLMPTTSGYAISLKNTEPYTALQMDIQLPNDAPLNAHLTDSRSDGHSIICLDLGNGHHRIAVYSLNGHAIMGNDGILLQLETYGKHDGLPEIYNVQLTNRLCESVTLSDISFPTDITNVNTDEHTDLPTYNVQGIHAPKHYRGIIIQDGRKKVEKR